MEHKLFALEKNSLYKAQETAFQKDQVNTPTIQLFKVYFYMHTCFKKNKNFKIQSTTYQMKSFRIILRCTQITVQSTCTEYIICLEVSKSSVLVLKFWDHYHIVQVTHISKVKFFSLKTKLTHNSKTVW